MANKKPEAKNSERYRKEKARQEKSELKKAKKNRDSNEPVHLIRLFVSLIVFLEASAEDCGESAQSESKSCPARTSILACCSHLPYNILGCA